jgi:hypothetical protein
MGKAQMLSERVAKLSQFCCKSGLLDPTHQLSIKLNIKKVTEPVYMQGPNTAEPMLSK